MASEIDLLRSSIEENDQLYFVVVVEIKYLFSWLLQNNLFGVEMLFEIQKPRRGYSARNTIRRILFLKYINRMILHMVVNVLLARKRKINVTS